MLKTSSFEKWAEKIYRRYFYRHPLMLCFFMLTVPPVGILLALIIFTALLSLPAGLLLCCAGI